MLKYVLLGTIILGASSALVGVFTFLRKRALVGDAIAHAILPGVCLAYLFFDSKNPAYLILGAIVTGWLSIVLIDWISQNSKLKTDTAIGLILSVFFGFGILLLTAIQGTGNASQSGLDKFLFGKAASMTQMDVWVFSGISLFLILIILLFYKEFKLICFNKDFAKSVGLPVRFLEFILATLTVLAVAVGIQAVGVVLMAALLITPASGARFWTNSLSKMILLAMIFGAVSGFSGTLISYALPAMPTGPWIVVILSVIAITSIIIAPRKGIYARIRLQKQNQRKILFENVLKLFFKLSENLDDKHKLHKINRLHVLRRGISKKQLLKGLNILKRKELVISHDKKWALTKKGLNEARRVVRLHRLWELYLNQKLKLAPDHVHNDAEALEHIITPELEKQLELELGFPTHDPHDSEIPSRY